ncbi:Uncharacterized protein OS=Chthoniobacter flavus Ellin428 GN=CfE428DRAFT_3014 PE=4 SV=1 [Gemmata massiliana]|uniref:Uncharacterized protein n=1 Tax=Gemmata massiliana TaxID=1210884 RepID=A0A6P2CPZ9_9BACT|nr:hypothetical protein [Gemmata massiliana]VTR90919.1 Uncharacterized protein OS=Chthoniobacter flavus Ellin428 GN=CfE428DRAFT_3014 PE=4 SV=1 [Gemmata massiliana]
MRTLTALFALVFLSPLVGCGKRELKDFRQFTSPDGKYTVLMPGTPYTEVRNEYGFQLTTHAVEVWGEGYAVSSADIPAGTPCDLSGAVTGLAQKVNGTATRSEGASRNGSGWREFEIEGQSPHKFYSGRVLFTRNRFYIVFTFGPDAKLSNQQVRTFLDSFRITDGGDTPGPGWAVTPAPPPTPAPSRVAPNPAIPAPPPTYSHSREPMLGSAFEPEFQDMAPNGGVLAGFDVWYGPYADYEIIVGIRPIYRTAGVDSAGSLHGTETNRGARALAKPGYAVGHVDVRFGGAVDSLTPTFMKIANGHLDVRDSYTGEKVGGIGGYGPQQLGDGTPIAGIVGRKSVNLTAFGVLRAGKK